MSNVSRLDSDFTKAVWVSPHRFAAGEIVVQPGTSAAGRPGLAEAERKSQSQYANEQMSLCRRPFTAWTQSDEGETFMARFRLAVAFQLGQFPLRAGTIIADSVGGSQVGDVVWTGLNPNTLGAGFIPLDSGATTIKSSSRFANEANPES